MESSIEKTLQQAVAVHKEGDLQEAERLYRAILQAQPLHPDANHNLGILAVASNKIDGALPLFKSALEANPSIEQFWLSYIDALIKEQQFDNAERVIEQAESQGVPVDRLNVLRAKFAPIQIEEIADSESPSQGKLKRLLKHYETGRFGDTEKLAVSITEEFPNHQFGWKMLAAVFGKLGKKSEALNAAQKVVALCPGEASAHSNLGVMLKDMGRIDEAEACLRQAIVLQSDDAESHNRLGSTLEKLDRLDEAEASYRQVIALRSEHPEALSNLGNVLRMLGNLDESQIWLRQAIACRPEYAEAHNNLGIALQEMGMWEEAKESFKNALTFRSNYAEAHNNLGNVLQEMGMWEEAEASLRQALTLDSNFSIAHNSLGVALQKMYRLGEAEVCYRKAIALKSDNVSAQSNLGKLLQKSERFDEATELYTKVLEIKPGHAEASHMLAALTGETTPKAPRDYVKQLFDEYAPKFEDSLVHNLDYKIPNVICEMIMKHNVLDSLGSVLDLGCGTGLLGKEIKQFCEHLEGVDLSDRMLDGARGKNVYDKLTNSDIADYLLKEDLDFDYFIFTDVFVYVGDLSNVFQLIQFRNKSGGKLVFSTEDTNRSGYFLEQSGRYSHSKQYIEKLCEAFNYQLSHFETHNLRKQKNQYISGGLYILDF